MKLTSEEYVNQAGLACPNCGSTEGVRTVGQLESDGSCAWQDVECTNCGAAWTDEYKLTGYDHLSTD